MERPTSPTSPPNDQSPAVQPAGVAEVPLERDAGRAATHPAVADDPSGPDEVAPGDLRAEELPRDLRAADEAEWDGLDVPAGWEPVAAIARAVHADLAPLVTRITAAIAEEIEPYRDEVVPRVDLRGSVRRNLEALLIGLAERRPPTAEQLAVRQELGSRRAMQGLPVDALIKAYHIGYREVWARLVEALPPGDDAATTQLLTGATTVWQWVHEVTDALAAAHATTTRSLEARAVGARQRFVELLVAGDLGGREARRLARSLGLDPTGSFTVLVVRGATDELDAVELQRRLEQIAGRHAVAVRGTLVIAVSQSEDLDAIARACRRVFPQSAIAIGATRDGLDGARASLEDAEQTLAVTADGESVAFEDVWLWATLLSTAERLEPLLAAGHAVAEAHPHLAEAVRAFADAGFSVSEAGRRLDLHANTVSYRLDRWQELTGWNPRTFAGLTRSAAALGPRH